PSPLTAPFLCIVAPVISISTTSHVTSDPSVAGTGDTIINLGRHPLSYHWNNRHRLRQIDPGWVITVFQLLLPFLTVGAALTVIVSTPPCPNDALKYQVPRARTTSLPTFPTRNPNATPTSLQKAHNSPLSPANVTGFTGLGDSHEDTINQPVVLKQLHCAIAWITICSVKGYLTLDFCSADSDGGNGIQWTITFHPHTHVNTCITGNEDLSNILFSGISSYHSWAPQLVSVLEIPKEIVFKSNELGGEYATAIVPRIGPILSTLIQAVLNIEPEATMAMAGVMDSSDACVTAKEEPNPPATLVVAPPPNFTSNHDSPIPETGVPLLPGFVSGSVESEVDTNAIEEEPKTEPKKKVRRAGKRTAAMKRNMALRGATEAAEAGPSGSN
ncbi:hypothetical protein FS837_006210, partial [Tulasnella sp. UAMH 9824]